MAKPFRPIGMRCDLCGHEITETQQNVVPLSKMRQAAQDGFNPYKTIGIDMSMMLSEIASAGVTLSPDQIYQMWRKQVMKDTTDWGLCPVCAPAFGRATGIVPRPVSGPVSKKWWQFWR
jgi:hypothetical protein